MDNLQDYIFAISYFISNVLIPTLFSIALLVFIFNVFRYFVYENSDEAREKAKQLALYGIAAFVFLVSIWGIVNMLVWNLEIDSDSPIPPDYIEFTS